MRRNTLATVSLVAFTLAAAAPASAAGYRLVGWNNLGMHCMDADYAVLSLLPPYITLHAQLLDPSGRLVKDPGAIRVTYEAAFDAGGSINRSSAGKTNFWDHVQGLFGAALPVDTGLAGARMPGASNAPQPMAFDASASWFVADGVPITPTDDAGAKNTYPMMKLVARDPAGTLLASTTIVVPVSDEMSCRSCHGSGTSEEARPASGWVNDPDPDRDFRLNILRQHDDARGDLAVFQQALAQVGYNPKGLEATVREDGRSILCASCHASEALPGSGLDGIAPLTRAIHSSMADAIDPSNGLRLDDVDNRTACYTCHPGSATRCLRGAMGAAVATDGTMAMQCQSCHGDMKTVGAATRTGWLEEPRCDSCHTGTAVLNNGAIRYDTVFRGDGTMREAVDATFATNDDTPAPGLSLYRFSRGHGGLQCSACHGSTHAEYPSSHDSDNAQSVALQGHEGVLAECTSCHATTPSTVTGGPHGLHPIGASWVGRHGDVVEASGASGCRNCHGLDYRGTVLSKAQADRSFSTELGTKKFFRGAILGCYNCHRGPSSDDPNPNRAPLVQDAAAATTASAPVTIPLSASDADGNALTLRVVSQPSHGTVGLSAREARYYPDGVFTGQDTFTFAAWDGSTDSNLGTVRVAIDEGACPPGCETPSGCDPDCGAAGEMDAMVEAPRPETLRILPGLADARREVSLTVVDVDADGAAPGEVALEVLDGDCPAGTVEVAPRFAGGADSVVLSPGEEAVATVGLRATAATVDTPGARAPARCHLVAKAVAVGAVDPRPSNDEVALELNLLDRNDATAAPDHDVWVGSLVPVTVEIREGSTKASRARKPRFALAAPAGSGGVDVRVQGDDGTCPSGTIGTVDLDPADDGVQDEASLAPGASIKARVRVNAVASAFASAGRSPLRCTGFVIVTSEAAGGEVRNDLAEVVVTVLDAND